MVNEASQHIRERKNNFGNINFLDKMLIINDGASGNEDCLLNHQPSSQTRKEKDGVIVHLKLDNSGENYGQNEKKKEGIKYSPKKSQDRMTISKF